MHFAQLTPRQIKTEVLAGVATFLTMVYISFVNPVILNDAGMDQSAVFTATCLVTAFGCVLIGLAADAPIAIAPGMALNIYFSYGVVQGLGFDWQHALAMVFISGVAFFIISLTPIRRVLVDAIPQNLQIAILIGISLLIALIALRTNDIIVKNPQTLMSLGDVLRSESLLFFLGFLLILLLDYYAIKGAIIIGILTVSAISYLLGITQWQGLIDLPPSIAPTFLQLDFSGMASAKALKATFTFFLITVFDATGTLIGLFNRSFFTRENHQSQRIANSLTADAAASSMAGFLGTASTSPFIESAAGIEEGGKTGLTAIVIGIGFVLILFFYPLAKMIPVFAVGPALLYVSCCMMRHVRDLSFRDMTDTAPCIVTIMMIPFTTSIADGIGAGVIVHLALKAMTRKPIPPILWGLGILFVFFFALGQKV